MGSGGFKLQWFLQWLLSSPPFSKIIEICFHLKTDDNLLFFFLQLETVNYFCAFWPFSWLSPFRKDLLRAALALWGWHLAGLLFPGIGASAHPRAGPRLLLGTGQPWGSEQTLETSWCENTGQGSSTWPWGPQKREGRKGPRQAFALCLHRQGPRPGRTGRAASPPPTLEEAFLSSITSKWDCDSVWGDTPEVPHEVAWSQPSGRAYPWESGLHKQAREHPPGRARAVPVRFSLAWVREGREDKV